MPDGYRIFSNRVTGIGGQGKILLTAETRRRGGKRGEEKIRKRRKKERTE